MTARVEVDEVQANVLYGYGAGYGHALYLRLNVNDPAGARDAVARWSRSGLISFSNVRKRDLVAHVNVAFTFEGLRQLELPAGFLEAFPPDFSRGGRRRAARLKDNWPQLDRRRPESEQYKDCHILVSILGKSPEACEQGKAALRLGESFAEVAERPAALMKGPSAGSSDHDHFRERFGFADGRSQPAIEGVDTDAVGDGIYAALDPTTGGLRRRLGVTAENFGLRPLARTWRLIRPGEFLLGYENEDGELALGPPAPLGPNGTFMVYREIDQFPDRFQTYVKKSAAKVGMSEDELAAKLVGRWQDGTPVARWREEPDIAANRRRANDFRYEDDPYGYGCPLGAHVRRANPRDALPGGAERTMRHRIIRRGMPYGPADGKRGEREGLAFICFSASIENGFEFIQREWINTGEAFGLGSEPDFLLQHPDADDDTLRGKTVIQGHRPVVLQPPDEPFVLVRGCEYLFVPSRSALTWLSQLAPAT
jgi:Dyp-type peroxidase family